MTTVASSMRSQQWAFGRMATLEGQRVVRLVYLDEAGTSAHEPIVVFSGVMIHGNDQLVPLENALDDLVKKHIPDDDQDGFIFHATNIFSGTKYFKDEIKWPFERRMAILNDLAELPAKFELPVAVGFVQKAGFPSQSLQRDLTQKEMNVGTQAVAFAMCTMQIERAMREAFPDEIALMVAEDNHEAKNAIKEAHLKFRSKEFLQADGIPIDCFPLTRIRDTVHFAKKPESKPLQLADTCAFIVKGHLTRNKFNPRLYEILSPWLLGVPTEAARVPI
jgi:hypothetical protein